MDTYELLSVMPAFWFGAAAMGVIFRMVRLTIGYLVRKV